MNHASLFNGIGGFQYAAELVGWNNIMSCEIDPFCNQVTKYHYPNCIQHGDIKETDFTIYRGRVDVLTGGFPCQPFSVAGKQLGTEDERHLWPEMLRAIREIAPTWVVGENVRGIVNWSGGLVFEQVCADLEAEGYEVQPFLLPACAVNAPHRRDRIWFVAFKDPNKDGWRSDKWQKESVNREQRNISTGNNERISTNHDEVGTTSDTKSRQGERMRSEQREPCEQEQGQLGGGHREDAVTDTDSYQRYERGVYTEGQEQAERHVSTLYSRNDWRAWKNFPTQSPICFRDDGFPAKLDGITFSKWRNESIKGYGNAIVPQVAVQIFKAINQFAYSK